MHKYRARRTFRHGHVFASLLEADVYDHLLLEFPGEPITFQVNVYLTLARIALRPDFFLPGLRLYCEAKGMETPAYRIKRKLWMHYGPGPLRVYVRSGKKIIQKEEIIPAPLAIP
jgi:hypothetical protein